MHLVIILYCYLIAESGKLEYARCGTRGWCDLQKGILKVANNNPELYAKSGVDVMEGDDDKFTAEECHCEECTTDLCNPPVGAGNGKDHQAAAKNAIGKKKVAHKPTTTEKPMAEK